jgi:uncharacterized repeat protein (TIGR01451 family)
MVTSNPERRRHGGRSLLLLILLLLLLVAAIFCCGQISLLTLRPKELGVGVRPRVTADYGPWPWVQFRPLDPVLVTLLVEEQIAEETATGTAPAMVVLPTLPERSATPDSGVGPLPSPTLTASPFPPTAPPTDRITETPRATSTATATGTLSPTPSPTITLTASATTTTTQTPTATATGTLSPTPSPTATLTPSATATATATATLTPTATNTPLPSATSLPAPLASFYAVPATANAPAAITFMNATAGLVSSYAWTFGDGVGSSAATNPVYTYTIPGTYAVTLTAHGPGGSSTYTAYVTILQPSPVASFFANPPLGPAPLGVAFGNTSTGAITAYSWSFGDGVGSSTQATPTYTYTVPGSYLVTLTVFGPGGSSTASVLIYAYAPPTPTLTPTRRPTRTPTPTPTSTATPGAAADLVVSKTASDPAPSEGASVTFTVTVTNNGPDTASGVEITDNLPVGVTFGVANATQGSYAGGVWTVGTLANGASASLDLTVSVNAGTAGNTIANTATVTASDQTDPDPANDTASAVIIPVPPSIPTADLTISKTVDNPNPAEGASVTFTVTVTNNGPDNADGIQITDTLPAGTTYVNQGGPGSYDQGTGIWTITTTLSAGQSVQKRIDVRVEPGTAGTTVTNTAVITALNQTDPDPANDTASVPFHVTGTDLSISKTVDNPAPSEGGTITYTVTLTNNGPDDAPSGVQVTDSLPAGLVYSASLTSQGTYDNLTGLWDVGSLAAGGSATLSITAQTAPGSAGSTIPNTATITAFTIPDTASGNDSATVNITVAAGLNAELAVTKSVNNPFPLPGDQITFTVTLTNNGPGAATGIGVLDIIPPGLTLVSHTPSQGNYASGVWTVGGLAASGSATLTLLTQVNPGTGGSLITNTALISAADQPDPNLLNNIAFANVNVRRVADLSLGKTVDNPNPNELDNVVFTVTLTNNGPNDATGITVTDGLPGGLSFVSANASQGIYGGGAWSVGNLASGANATLLLTAQVDPGTGGSTITNTATITAAAEVDPNAANNTASAAIIPVPPVAGPTADLVLTMTIDYTTPAEGSTVAYWLRVTNNGPDNADGIEVTDILPPGLSYFGQGGPGSYDPVTGVWTISTTLSAGQSTQKRIDAVADSGTAGTTITNTATITALNQTDPEPSNNTASVDLTVQ